MIQRFTNLNKLKIVTNYINPNDPSEGNHNIKVIEDRDKDKGIFLLQIKGLTDRDISEVAKMLVILPIETVSTDTKFFVREVLETYDPKKVNWNNRPKINESEIESEYLYRLDGSKIAGINNDIVILDLTKLALKWKENGNYNRSVAIYMTKPGGKVYTPLHKDVLYDAEVVIFERATKTGLTSNVSYVEKNGLFAGVSYVNANTGGLINKFFGFKTDSKTLPITIDALYADRRTNDIEYLEEKKSLGSNWRMSFDYGFSRTEKKITLVRADGLVTEYNEITKQQAEDYQIKTEKGKIFINYSDFSYIEEEWNEITIFDRSKNQMRLDKKGLIKEIIKSNGKKIVFQESLGKIVGISADQKNVIIMYKGDFVERIDFVEENKSLYFESGMYGPVNIKLQDIMYKSSSTVSGKQSTDKLYIDLYEAKYEYNTQGMLRKMTDTNQNINVSFEYMEDKVTKVIESVNDSSKIIDYTRFIYDKNKNMTLVVDNINNSEYLCFNNYGQCIQKIDRDGNIVKTEYVRGAKNSTRQRLKNESKVVYNTKTTISNPGFEDVDLIKPLDSGWKINNSNNIKVIDGGVHGKKCLMVLKNETEQTIITQKANINAGDHEISFFAKTKDLIGKVSVNAKVTYTIFVGGGMLGKKGPVVYNEKVERNVLVTKNEKWTKFTIKNLDIEQGATSILLELKIVCDIKEGKVLFDDFQVDNEIATT